ncbi:MAG TPA: hypothetical protein VFQ38_03305 [Longimicrobiales bacterium]|nr:hypothetical protein [Longimicrobiales bacterium]
MTGEDGSSTLSKLITWFVIAVVALIAIRVAFMAVGVGLFLLFRVGPLVLLGYLLWRAWRWLQEKPAE